MRNKKKQVRLIYTCDCGKAHDVPTGTFGPTLSTDTWDHFCTKCGRANVVKNGQVIGGGSTEVPR